MGQDQVMSKLEGLYWAYGLGCVLLILGIFLISNTLRALLGRRVVIASAAWVALPMSLGVAPIVTFLALDRFRGEIDDLWFWPMFFYGGVVLVISCLLMRGFRVYGTSSSSFRSALLHAAAVLGFTLEGSGLGMRVRGSREELAISIEVSGSYLRPLNRSSRAALESLLQEMRKYFLERPGGLSLRSCAPSLLSGGIQVAAALWILLFANR